MNNEKYSQIIDEAYKNYMNNWPSKIPRIGPCLKEEFINKCKTDAEFSQTWDLKIEERELSLEERLNLVSTTMGEEKIRTHEDNLARVEKLNIPTKLIAVTHNNETIEIYE